MFTDFMLSLWNWWLMLHATVVDVELVSCVPLSSFERLSHMYLVFIDSGQVEYSAERCTTHTQPQTQLCYTLATFALCAYTLTLLVAIKFACSSYFEPRSPLGNDWTSWYISILIRMCRQPLRQTCTLRSRFIMSPEVKNFPARNHTHPNSAAIRNAGSSFMDLFAKLSGLRAYFLQSSAADARHGREGCRSYHWAKDVTVKSRKYEPRSDDILCITDVDMHMDMPQLLCDNFLPVIISSFQPATVAHGVGEFAFTFDEHDNVTYLVAGGAEYGHKVWQYGVDVLLAVSKRWGMYHYHIYNVDRRLLDQHHQLILLTPIRRFVSPFIDIHHALHGTKLRRMRVAETIEGETFLRLSCMTTEGMMRSTGRPGQYVTAYTTAVQDDAIASLARIGKNHELTPATIKTAIEGVDQASATILTEYHRCKRGSTADVVFPVDKSVMRFQYTPSEYDPFAKASMTPFMSPLILGAYAPDRCLANDRQAIEGRVTSVKPPDTLILTAELLKYMTEFGELLVPKPHVLHPVDEDTVWDKQSRPAQRQILDRASDIAASTCENGLQSFVKSESYGKITDPRIISTVPGVNKLNYSRYVYSFTSLLRSTRWYAFARTPKSVAERVATLCSTASWVALTDLSRFDGRVSFILRTLESMIMIRSFHPQYHQEMNELMATQKNQRARTTYGVKYSQGMSRASGSAETADFNSLDNAFMAYVALRRTRNNEGETYSPQDAWQRLGIYGGDDGLTPDVDGAAYVRTCAEIGQVLELETIERGGAGVNFLARFYGPDVWHGATDSMCDVLRQVTKLHTTVSLPSNVTAIRKLAEKLTAFHLTDANTPIIGEFSTMFVSTFPAHVPAKLGLIHGLGYVQSGITCDEQYPNQDSASGWMTDHVNKTMPDFDRSKFTAWLAAVALSADEEDVLGPPLCGSLSITHTVKVDVSVNGMMVAAPRAQPSSTPKTKVPYTKEDLERMSKLPCRAFASGECKFKTCRYKH